MTIGYDPVIHRPAALAKVGLTVERVEFLMAPQPLKRIGLSRWDVIRITGGKAHKRAEIFARDRRHSIVSKELKERIVTLQAEGLALRKIVELTKVPLATVWGIVKRANSQAAHAS